MENNLNLDKLTPEQLDELQVQIEARKKQKEELRKSEVSNYFIIRDETIKKVFEKLTRVNSDLEIIKKEVFDEFGAVLNLKKELFKTKEDQFSDTFTTNDGKITIILGQNTIDRWDETVSAGIDKINEHFKKLIEERGNDKDVTFFINMVRDLLKPNKDGVLKASRVLDLEKRVEEHGDQELIDAVKIIRDSHRPDRTSTYVKAIYKDANGIKQNLGLSMSSVG
jgi:hypothetical protein